jgi:hypothetical protein
MCLSLVYYVVGELRGGLPPHTEAEPITSFPVRNAVLTCRWHAVLRHAPVCLNQRSYSRPNYICGRRTHGSSLTPDLMFVCCVFRLSDTRLCPSFVSLSALEVVSATPKLLSAGRLNTFCSELLPIFYITKTISTANGSIRYCLGTELLLCFGGILCSN